MSRPGFYLIPDDLTQKLKKKEDQEFYWILRIDTLGARNIIVITGLQEFSPACYPSGGRDDVKSR